MIIQSKKYSERHLVVEINGLPKYLVLWWSAARTSLVSKRSTKRFFITFRLANMFTSVSAGSKTTTNNCECVHVFCKIPKIS